MPAALPCSLTQTVNGGDLYVPQANVSEPVGQVVYYCLTSSASTQQGALVNFNANSPAPGTPTPNVPVGTGRPFPIGTYAVKISCRPVDATNGFTRTCFFITYDGLQVYAGGASTLYGTNVPAYTLNVNPEVGGAFSILSWNGYGLTNPSQLACEIVYLGQHAGTTFPSGT